jgi:NAD-dependent dihydropyrimidine dehydrogenase PreA subunit
MFIAIRHISKVFYLTLGGAKMAYYINEECINCGACEPECPASCITAGDDIYIVDEEICTDCGNCAEVCPVDAALER